MYSQDSYPRQKVHSALTGWVPQGCPREQHGGKVVTIPTADDVTCCQNCLQAAAATSSKVFGRCVMGMQAVRRLLIGSRSLVLAEYSGSVPDLLLGYKHLGLAVCLACVL